MAAKHQRIKVLFTIPNFDTAGSGKAMLKIALGLNTSVFEPHIACFNSNGAFFKVVEASGIPVHIFSFTTEMRPIMKGLHRCWEISRFFKNHQFDLIHSFHYAPDYSEALAAKMAGIKWIFVKKNMNWGGSSANGWRLRSLLASRIAVQNKDMMREFYPGWKKVFYLTRGVDTAEFYPRERNLALLEEFGVGTNQRIIMCVANMVPVKGIEILILAFSRLTDKEAVLMLVGDRNNEYGALLEKQADELQIANRVIFTGKRLNIADFLSIAGVFVLPTLNQGRKEGSPVSLLEAMACGVPVLGTAIPGIKDQLENFPELLFEPGNPSALTEKLEALLLLDENATQQLRQRLLDSIRGYYTIQREIRQHEELYENCLKIS